MARSVLVRFSGIGMQSKAQRDPIPFAQDAKCCDDRLFLPRTTALAP